MDENKVNEELYNICVQKRQGKIELSWDDLNSQYGKPFNNGEGLRCWAKKRLKKEGKLPSRNEVVSVEVKEKLSEVELQIINLRKEKVKIQDLRTKLNKSIRDSARKEDLYDLIVSNVKEISKSKPLISVNPTVRKTNKTGCLQLSDWHYSLTANNFLNTYNTDVFNSRINTVVEKTIEFGETNKIEELVVLLQGDFVSSSIHDILRIQNQEDLISQIMTTSEVLAEILTELSSYFKLRVTLVTDNHSRVTPNKKDSLDVESYIRITEWYLRTRLKDNKNINILINELGHEISTFDIYDYKCCSVHGNNDAFNNIVAKLSPYTRNIYDYIFSSHNHHLHIEETNMTTVLSNGCLSGVDDYSNGLRMSSHPLQIFSVYTKEDGLEQIYPIKVK